MNVSRQFLKDFAYVANRYGWTPEVIEEAKAEIRANPKLVRYWTILASAHRQGYEQTQENGYLRLDRWFEQTGRPNPFSSED